MEKKKFRDVFESRVSTLVCVRRPRREAALLRVSERSEAYSRRSYFPSPPLITRKKRERKDNIYTQRERYVRTKNYTFLDNYKLIIAIATITTSTATTTKTTTTWTTTIAEAAPTTTR